MDPVRHFCLKASVLWVFCLIGSLGGCASDDGSQEATPEVSPSPPADSPDVTPEVSPSPTPEATPVPKPALAVSSRAINFGIVYLGDAGDATLTVTNEGNAVADVEVTVRDVEGGVFGAASSGLETSLLEPGASFLVFLSFSPAEAGMSYGTVIIASNDPLEPEIAVDLTGEGRKKDQDGDGYSASEGDCNDADPARSPGTSETCDGVDNDCDGLADDGVQSTFYQDRDGDGYGNSTASTLGCVPVAGQVGPAGDCDDNNAERFPGNPEICDGIDNNCAGGVDEQLPSSTVYLDLDGDGHGDPRLPVLACGPLPGLSELPDDCADDDPLIYGEAPEYCDGVDNDCDDSIDEDGASTFYDDLDGDGFGDPLSAVESCEPAGERVPLGGDCDDSQAEIHPEAEETCDDVDNNCNGETDEGTTELYYADRDSDTFGSTSTVEACSAPPGYVETQGDCNDNSASTYPGASESCDGQDNNCDGTVDEGVLSSYYRDADSDGYGNAAAPTYACRAPSGTVSRSDDCDDTRKDIHPGATEVCDSVDNDCDGGVDEGVATSYYLDIDGDSYGDPATRVNSCTSLTGYITRAGDCNDRLISVSPLGIEVCNGLDDDCDGKLDSADTFDMTEGAIGEFNAQCDTFEQVMGGEVPLLNVLWPLAGGGQGELQYEDGILLAGRTPGATQTGWPAGCTYLNQGFFWFDTGSSVAFYSLKGCFSRGTDANGGDEVYLNISYEGDGIVGKFNTETDSDGPDLDSVVYSMTESYSGLEVWHISDSASITGVDIDATLELYDGRVEIR